MPYKGQRTTGEALISLQQSKIFEDFSGRIKPTEPSRGPQLSPAEIPRTEVPVDRVIAIDGSLITETLKNGFPGAEASLVQLALVYIDLRKLKDRGSGKIIPPKAFNEMDSAHTLQTVLPGRNIIREDGLQPRDFFRTTVFEALHGKIVQSGHETLLETYEALVSGRINTFRCPHFEDCGRKLAPSEGQIDCCCGLDRPIFSTDQLRFHERFNEAGPNGEPHGEVSMFQVHYFIVFFTDLALGSPPTAYLSG